MSKAEAKVWTLAEFLAWEAGQERRYEFVGGEPRMMTGGTQRHARIGGRIYAALDRRLTGERCEPYGPDLRIPIPRMGNSRYPDAAVDCGEYDANSHDASKPVVVFEVLSKSTAWYDQTRKLRDYETVSDIEQYVCVSQSEIRVSVWTRNDEGRFIASDDIIDAAAELKIRPLGFSIPLTEIYERTGLLSIASKT